MVNYFINIFDLKSLLNHYAILFTNLFYYQVSLCTSLAASAKSEYPLSLRGDGWMGLKKRIHVKD